MSVNQTVPLLQVAAVLCPKQVQSRVHSWRRHVDTRARVCVCVSRFTPGWPAAWLPSKCHRHCASTMLLAVRFPRQRCAGSQTLPVSRGGELNQVRALSPALEWCSVLSHSQVTNVDRGNAGITCVRVAHSVTYALKSSSSVTGMVAGVCPAGSAKIVSIL